MQMGDSAIEVLVNLMGVFFPVKWDYTLSIKVLNSFYMYLRKELD
jgi:hypothetical protein